MPMQGNALPCGPANVLEYDFSKVGRLPQHRYGTYYPIPVESSSPLYPPSRVEYDLSKVRQESLQI